MHIPDGILPVGVTAAGYVATAAVTWYSLRKIKQKEDPRQDIPKASLMTAAFFVVTLIHIPVPPTSVHLVLNGLMGVLLGYYAFPAILIGLFFQAVMFGHGGLTTLGVNAVIMGVPAIVAAYVFRLSKIGNKESPRKDGVFGFLAGFVAIGLSVAMFVVILLTSLPADLNAAVEQAAIFALAIAHLPLMAIEGVITAFLVVFLRRVRPAMLGGV
jgi:cobalt/nickel transport system permease protein